MKTDKAPFELLVIIACLLVCPYFLVKDTILHGYAEARNEKVMLNVLLEEFHGESVAEIEDTYFDYTKKRKKISKKQESLLTIIIACSLYLLPLICLGRLNIRKLKDT